MINELEQKYAEGRATQQQLLRGESADIDAWETEVAGMLPDFLSGPIERYAQNVTMKEGEVVSGTLYPPDHVLSRIHSRLLTLRRHIEAHR